MGWSLYIAFICEDVSDWLPNMFLVTLEQILTLQINSY